METVKCQGKIREKSGNFEVDDKWQPWFLPLLYEKMLNALDGSNKAISYIYMS